MKRKVALRRLKLTCNECDCTIKKGDVYYREREVFADYEYGKAQVYAHTFIYCARCIYTMKKREERFKRFAESGTCTHPITSWNYSLMSGECIYEPDYEECVVCKKIL